jgi:tRNA-specific 2-thiouridylase
MNQLVANKAPKDTRIVVAMSGGVDSSVVACMLKEQGYDVIGITLQLYDIGQALKKKNACCAGVDIMDAKKVAQKHNFPHYVLNYENLFKESVIDDFADSYLRGETPIPCVKCNQSVKFRDLMKVAHDLNADAMATGHYIRRLENGENAHLLKAVDENKDQSYFLFATTQEQLNFLRFPLGGFTKEETRNLAKKYDLDVANKPDSQDICFVPNGDYASVIAKHRPQAFKSGDLLHIETREKLGQHNGIINFTLGQRRGLGISYPEPLYVVKIEPKENIVYVGEEKFLQNRKFIIREVNWLAKTNELKEVEFEGKKAYEVMVRLRSNHEEEKAFITKIDGNKYEITMKSMTRAITPGQACVIYDDERVLGGGWITKEIV